MSSIKQRPAGPGNWAAGWGEAFAVWSALAAVALLVLFTWVPVHLTARLEEGAAGPPGNPVALLVGLARGDVAWTTATTVAAIALAVAVLAAVAVVATSVRRRRGRRGGRRARTDRAVARLGRGRDTHALSGAAARESAQRLGVAGGVDGLPIGRAMAGGKPLVQDWEAVSVDVWGPRAGKTTSRAIPALLAAPGAVVATSNKRDLVDATRGPRAAHGPVWVFDPQRLIGEEPSWWWDPLSYVVDETAARELAGIFSSATRSASARTDAYFDGAALDLLSGLLLAAAVDQRPLTDVYEWLTDPNDDTPAEILAAAGHRLPAASVRGVVNAPDKQRAGVYGTAAQTCSFMTNSAAMRWVTPPPADRPLPAFSPARFAATTETLYLLSREGHGNAGALVTALTVAVCEAAEEHARTQPGGRLTVPMVAVLDEAANVCRWRQLPDLYSHYGSRGIALMTFLQSWSQGVEVWGRDGMRKLWSAATVKVYGGGVSEVEFLEELSRLVGDYTHLEISTSVGKQGRSTSRQRRTDRILDVADLASLDRGRALVFAAGALPTLARTEPWWEGPHQPAVAASLARYEPRRQGEQVDAVASAPTNGTNGTRP